MLSYLILTTRALLLVTIVFAAITAYANISANKYQKNIIWTFTIVATLISIIISILRNTTNYIDTAILNGYIYSISLISFILFLIFVLTPLDRSVNKVICSLKYVFLSLILLSVIVYALPDVWAYPYHVLQSEKTIISTDFLLSVIGMLFGIILMVVLYFSVKKSIERISVKSAKIVLTIILLINFLLRISGMYSVLIQKKIIKSIHAMFLYTVFVKNHSDYFIFAGLFVVCLVGIVLWILSFRQNEPYRNPAQHRIIKAKWRSIRRWATCVIITSFLSVCTLTVVEKLNETDTTLSPVEDATLVDDENVYVSFELVSDGHLHRFAYETDDGVAIRFIIIQKPNSSSYGVGLDACDVCGETGYYEKDGQVVCNLCDVVMNISTIGFKGGCNPIVIPYSIENGQIIVPISGLLEYESEFK